VTFKSFVLRGNVELFSAFDLLTDRANSTRDAARRADDATEKGERHHRAEMRSTSSEGARWGIAWLRTIAFAVHV
jgi:hypothetical protein